MERKENNKAYTYGGNLKKNVNAAGEKIRREKRVRTAIIAAASALLVMVVAMSITIAGLSPSAKEKRLLKHIEAVQKNQASVSADADSLVAAQDTLNVQPVTED